MSDEAAKTTAAAPASTAPTRGRQLRVMLHKLWLVRKRSVGQNMGCVGCCCMLKKDKYEDDEVTCADSKGACMCWFCEP